MVATGFGSGSKRTPKLRDLNSPAGDISVSREYKTFPFIASSFRYTCKCLALCYLLCEVTCILSIKLEAILKQFDLGGV